MSDTTNKDPACPHCGERYGASAEIEQLRNQIAEFQKLVLAKSGQVRAETALRLEAEKRLADITEILEPFDPPENRAMAMDKIAILANPERYACDPIPACCDYHKDGGDTLAECWRAQRD